MGPWPPWRTDARVCVPLPDNGARWRSTEPQSLAVAWWAAWFFAPGFPLNTQTWRPAHTLAHTHTDLIDGARWAPGCHSHFGFQRCSLALSPPPTDRPHEYTQTVALSLDVTCKKTSYQQLSRELSTVASDKHTKITVWWQVSKQPFTLIKGSLVA